MMSDEDARIDNVLPLFKDGFDSDGARTAPDRATVRLAMLLAVIRGAVAIAKLLGGGAILLLAAVGLLALFGR